jgi:hypothetical protein
MAKSIPACGMAILATCCSVGCGRTVEAPPEAQGTGQGGAQGAGVSTPTSLDGGDTTCPAAVAPRSPLRRLTNFELNNTLRDLLGDTSRPADSLPPDVISPRNSFNDADLMSISSLLVDGYHSIFHELAFKVTRDAAAASSLTGCDPSQIGEDECKRTFINGFIPKAFRRALAAVDFADFDAVFTNGQKLGGDFASGVRAVIEVALQSPEFLYRVEIGDPADATRPTSYEMATRLSYFLWGSNPDSELRVAASKGELETREQIALQARRLLADERSHEMVRYYYSTRFRLGGAESNVTPPDVTPAFTTDLATLVEKQSELFIDEVTWNGPGDFRALLTAPFTWANGPLATFYGIPAVTGDAFQRVELDPTRRGGLLTQPSFLVAYSVNGKAKPLERGLSIFKNVLCIEIPLEPPDLNFPVVDDLPANATTRQRFERYSQDPICATCHRDLDPVGFAFEHYDAFGSWRDTENGQPIDASGELYKTDAKGKFNGAIELAQKLSTSHDAESCFIGGWMSYAYGRQETADDACSRKLVEKAFVDAKGNVRELLVALTQTDAFLRRSVKE